MDRPASIDLTENLAPASRSSEPACLDDLEVPCASPRVAHTLNPEA